MDFGNALAFSVLVAAHVLAFAAAQHPELAECFGKEHLPAMIPPCDAAAGAEQQRARTSIGGRSAVRASYALLCIGLLFSFAGPVGAHDIYRHLTSRSGKSCCDGSDCRPARYRILPEGVDMLINDRWIAIPRGALQYRVLEGDTGETGGGHWCGEPWEGSFITYCAFLPPTLAAVH